MLPPGSIRALGCLLITIASLWAPAGRGLSVRITEADGARVQVALYPGDVLRVELPSQPAAGLQWTLAGRAPAQLEKLAATQRTFGGRLTNQGTSSFAWRAISAGEADLTLDYGLPASRLVHPDRVVQVHVSIAAEASVPGSTTAPDLLAQPEQAGTYARTQPCADCIALREQLTLYHGDPSSLFLLRRTYQDAPGGTITTIATGLWSTSQGAADPGATIYQLVGSDLAYLLRVDGDRLIPLDPQQIPLPAPPGTETAFRKVAEP